MTASRRLAALALGGAIGAAATFFWGRTLLPPPRTGDLSSAAALLGAGATASEGASSGSASFTDLGPAGSVSPGPPSPSQPLVIPPPPDAAARTSGRWATVLEVRGAHALRIQDETGSIREVEYIGVMGPGPSQREWRQRVSRAHQALIGGGRVLVESQAAAAHVFVEGALDAPVSARLLAGGNVWVYPNATHHLAQWFADLQAEAVRSQAGLWSESGSRTLWRPRDRERGGFPADPRIVPALDVLAADPIGRSLLAAAERFPPEIRFARLPETILGRFARREFSVAVAERWADSDPASVAAVLVHELRHAGDLIASGIIDVDTGCLDGEERAFEVASFFWFSRGASRPCRATEPVSLPAALLARLVLSAPLGPIQRRSRGARGRWRSGLDN